MPQHARLSRRLMAPILKSPLADNPLLLAVAGIGFSVSFQTIAHEAVTHHLPGWPPLYPIGVDVSILALIVEARRLLARRRSDLLPRVLAWVLAVATVYINVHGSPPHDWIGRALHAVMPCLWIAFLELTRWRQRADIRKAQKADPIPLARWVLSPLRTPLLKRRMVLANVNSYPLAAALEEARLHMRDIARAHYGRWRWRLDTPSVLRSRIRHGRLGDEVMSAVTSAVAIGRSGGWEAAVRQAVIQAVTEGDKLSAGMKQERRQIATPPPRQDDSQPARQKARQKGATTTRQKRAKATRLLTASPTMPLAEVAAKSGVSERTAQRIKSGLPRQLHVAGE